MSWLFSRVLVEDCLERNHSAYAPSVLLSWTGIADAFLHSDKMSDTYEVFSRYGMTFVPLTADRGEAELMLCLEDFLVRHLARRLEGATMRLTSGQRCVGYFLRSNPIMYLQKTYHQQLLSKPLMTAPRWVTKPKCFPFQRKTWVLTTKGKDFGYLHTPTTKANYAAASMKKWPACRNFVEVFGSPNSIIHEWLMGWPEGWSDIKPLETDKFQLWQQRLYGHLRMLDDSVASK